MTAAAKMGYRVSRVTVGGHDGAHQPREISGTIIIYAETSSIFLNIEDFEKTIAGDTRGFPCPEKQDLLPAKLFLAYRKNGGKCQTLMPDFYIGARYFRD
jgi:hypothetical protein